MMKFRLQVLFLLILCFSCMKGPYTKSCELTTGYQTSPAAGIVAYEVHITGSAYLQNLTYYTGSGPVTVEKPTLPFSISLPVEPNERTGLQVKGIAIEGTIKIQHTVITGTDTVRVQDGCEG
jgi:hypothetical protein